MTRLTSMLPSLAAVLLLSTAPLALAKNSGSMATPTEAGGELPSPAAIKAFEHVKVPITQAIEAAEHESHGKAIEARFKDENGKPVFRVRAVENNTVWQGTVDATSGQVIGQGKTTPESKLDHEDKTELSAFHKAKTSLTEAIKTAEQKEGGKALDADMEARGGQAIYEIQLLKNGTLHMANVDPESGQVATNQGGLGANAGTSDSSSAGKR